MNYEAHESDPIQRLWQSQSVQAKEYDMTRIRSAAAAFDSTIRSRNRRECFVAWPLAGIFAAMSIASLVSGNVVSALGTLVVAAACLWIVFVLRRFGVRSAADAELALDGRAFLASYRGELSRQRRLLSTAWLWYAMPLSVGLLALELGRVLQRGEGLAEWSRSGSVIITAVVFLAVGAVNGFAARALGRQLARLGPADGAN